MEYGDFWNTYTKVNQLILFCMVLFLTHIRDK